MVKRVTRIFTREVRGLHEAAYLLAAFALLSQVLALVRDRLFAAQFGAGETLAKTLEVLGGPRDVGVHCAGEPQF